MFADDLIKKLIVAHRAYKAVGKSKIKEEERYRILVELSDLVANAASLAP